MGRCKVKRVKYVCVGGPWPLLQALLPTETIVFTVGSFTGKYVMGRWEDV